MKRFHQLLFSIVCGACFVSLATAQQGMGPVGQNSATDELSKILGKDAAFSATAHMTVEGKGNTQSMQMKYAALNGHVRAEMDMTQASGIPPQAVAQMKAMGMAETVTIHRADDQATYLVYPGLKSYCKIELPDKASFGGSGGEIKPPKVEKTELGKETIDGHPCVKSKIVVTMADGDSVEAIVWEATDLNNLPIQTQFESEMGKVTTQFKDVSTTKPDAALFEPPAGYKSYSTPQELMMGAMQGMMPK